MVLSSYKKVLVGESQFLSLAYHDIFDYPLDGEQLARWQMGGARGGEYEVGRTGDLYHLLGRGNITLLRKSREKLSAKKIGEAEKAAKVISEIPTVLFVGLTGSLAMRNAEEGSDIDFLIVTKKGTLWTTRILVHAALALSGIKLRKRGQGSAKDKLCLNMWVDEDNLEVPEENRNIYAAHEVLQVVPLINKEEVFRKFLETNRWAGGYWKSGIMNYDLGIKTKEKSHKSYLLNLKSWSFRLLEPIFFGLQLSYMRRRITRETIERGRAFFHPIDWGRYVIKEFESRKGGEELWTNKVPHVTISG